MCKHANLTKRAQEVTNSNETKEHMVEHGNIVDPKTQADLSLTASEDESRTRRQHLHRHFEKAPQRKSEKQRDMNFHFSHAVRSRPRVVCSLSTLSDSDTSDFENWRRSKRPQVIALEVIHTVNTRFRKAVNYRTYRLGNRFNMSDHIVSKNICK